MAQVQSYLKYGIVLVLSYFSPLLGIIIATITKFKKLDEKVMYVSVIGCVGAFVMYTFDFIYLSMK